jgi:hypothetical protein
VNPSHLQPVPLVINQQRRIDSVNRSSGIRNVTWHKQVGKWQVQVKYMDKSYYGGLFVDLQDAAHAAVQLRNQIFGADPERERRLGGNA